MADDIINIDTDGIVDDTLNQLRDQRDLAENAVFTGQAAFNPQVFADKRYKHFVVGPLLFDNPFDTTPNIVFGLVNQSPTDNTQTQTGLATSFEPFVVHPYVYKWKTINSRVDGFWLGLYAITSPPGDASTALINWQASGKASSYINQSTEDSWMENYDYGDTDFLTVDDDATDDGTSYGLGGTSDGGDF